MTKLYSFQYTDFSPGELLEHKLGYGDIHITLQMNKRDYPSWIVQWFPDRIEPIYPAATPGRTQNPPLKDLLDGEFRVKRLSLAYQGIIEC